MNTSAPFMIDSIQNDIAKKQRAELYMRLYQYAAEDFVAHSDFNVFLKLLESYHRSVESQLAVLMTAISTHIHQIPPHSDKSMSSTLPPTQSKVINWKDLPKPVFTNTTLTAPNLSGNFVFLSPGSEGDITPEMRRAKALSLTLKPVLPPIMNMKIV